MKTTQCRSCRSSRLTSILDLGVTPLANALLSPDQLSQPEPSFPLELVFCGDCSLLQITETVPPEQLFRNYLYFSSFSETMLGHAKALADRLIAERRLNSESLVVEAASNDGYLLRNYVARGVPVLGVEPALNVAAAATASGIPTLAEFFGESVGRKLAGEGRRADVFHANNVLAHVADLNGFVQGIAEVLEPTGVAVVEAPYAGEMLANTEFDTIYHEHLCYFSAHALDKLFAAHGLRVVDIEELPIHGGSLRVFVAHEGARVERSARATAIFAREVEQGMLLPAFYGEFAQRVWALRAELRKALDELKASGKRLAAYGASAKGSTLLNAFGIGKGHLDFVVDRSTHKQGLYTPGTHLPILAPDALLRDMPDYVLLLTWNFADEILLQQSEYRSRGGRFVIPIPHVRIV